MEEEPKLEQTTLPVQMDWGERGNEEDKISRSLLSPSLWISFCGVEGGDEGGSREQFFVGLLFFLGFCGEYGGD